MIIESSIVFKDINILTELFLGIAIVYLVLHCTFLAVKPSYPLIQVSVLYLGILTLILASCLLLNDQLDVLELTSFNGTIANDYTSFISKFVICLLALGSLFAIQPYLTVQKINRFEYVLLFLFSVLGLFLLCASNDLITTYLAIELQSLAFYVLSAFKKNSTFSVNAGIKYFILGAFASSLFLLGSSILYGVVGTVNFAELKTLFYFSPYITSKFNLNFNELEFLTDFLYYRYLLNVLKFDITYSLLNQMDSLAVFYERLGVSSPSSEIEFIFIINTLYTLLADSLFLLIFNFPGLDLGYFLFETYSENCLNISNIVFLFCISDISSNYLDNVFFLESFFNTSLINFALFLILISFFFKLAVAPFHAWAPDVYEGSPSSSTFFFAVVPKLAIFIVMLRIYYSSFYFLIEEWRPVIVIFVILTIITGSFGGLAQKKIKSLLVYSSISHMGYVLIAFSAGTFESFQILFCYLLVYSFSGFCIWSIFTVTKLKTNFLQKSNKDLTDLVLLNKSNSTLSFFFATVLFSVAGFPPMIGFLVKIFIFLSALDTSMYFVAVVSIVCSVVATFYYIRIIKILYFEKTLVGKLYYPISNESSIFIAILFSCILFLFVNPTLLFLLSFKFSLLF